MRWLLDEDVDVALCSWLHRRGDDCKSVPQFVRDHEDPRRADEAVAVLAHQQGRILVTHDVEFSRWRRERCIGHHLWLRCPEPVAVDVVARVYDEICAGAGAVADVWWRASATDLDRHHGWGGGR